MVSDNKRGLFITFEGIDGCGKSLMSKLLADWLSLRGQENICLTYEPGDTDLGAQIRKILLKKEQQNVSRKAEILLFAADRAQHVAAVLGPALAQGGIVICDRYIDSSLAYQCGGRGLSFADVRMLNDFSIDDCLPDLTFYLSVSVEKAMERRGKNIDRIELEDKNFHQRVKEVYDCLAAENSQRIKVIDASLPPNGVFAQIQKVMEDNWQNYGLAE
jgi:dTMP kinase